MPLANQEEKRRPKTQVSMMQFIKHFAIITANAIYINAIFYRADIYND